MTKPHPTFPHGVLSANDPAPVSGTGPRPGRLVIACDHGGRAVPAHLALGVPEADLARHIGYDIGAAGVARVMADQLGAELICQEYSRLVIDCNRPPSEPTAFPEKVDGSEIPSNIALAPAGAAARTAEIFHPYHAALSAALDRRVARGEEPVLIALHTYTPQHGDFPEPRPWPVCVLFDKDPALSLALSAVLQRAGHNVGENVPYQVGALGDYTIPVHAEARGIPHTLIEVRQDLVGDPAGEVAWGKTLAEALPEALSMIAA